MRKKILKIKWYKQARILKIDILSFVIEIGKVSGLGGGIICYRLKNGKHDSDKKDYKKNVSIY